MLLLYFLKFPTWNEQVGPTQLPPARHSTNPGVHDWCVAAERIVEDLFAWRESYDSGIGEIQQVAPHRYDAWRTEYAQTVRHLLPEKEAQRIDRHIAKLFSRVRVVETFKRNPPSESASYEFLWLAESIGGIRRALASILEIADRATLAAPSIARPASPLAMPKPPFTLSGAQRWSDITIRFIDGHSIQVTVGQAPPEKFEHEHLGFHGKAKVEPSIPWRVLEALAENHGVLTNRTPVHPNGLVDKYRVGALRKMLKQIFQIQGNPLPQERKTKSWRAAFSIYAAAPGAPT